MHLGKTEAIQEKPADDFNILHDNVKMLREIKILPEVDFNIYFSDIKG